MCGKLMYTNPLKLVKKINKFIFEFKRTKYNIIINNNIHLS